MAIINKSLHVRFLSLTHPYHFCLHSSLPKNGFIQYMYRPICLGRGIREVKGCLYMVQCNASKLSFPSILNY